MPAPITDLDVTKGFNDFKYCPYWQFKDPLDLSKKTLGKTPGPAKCGFNQDALYYCPAQKGDVPV